MQNKRAAFLRMVKTPQFDLWLRIETGRLAVLDSQLSIPPSEVKVEVRSGGRWVPAPAELS